MRDPDATTTFSSGLPAGWTVCVPEESDAEQLTDLLRRHEEWARGTATSTTHNVLVEISSPGSCVRRNIVVCDRSGVVHGWATAHDRAAGRMVFSMVVDIGLDESLADSAAEVLLKWADEAASSVGLARGLATQQIDTGAFAEDTRQQRWLAEAGFEHVRTWWQMNRPVLPEDVDVPEPKQGVRIRGVEPAADGMPVQDDLRAVHDILEDAFADHFNSHAEAFDEFLARLREDPGHRWDHWWLAELLDGEEPQPVGTLVGTVSGGGTAEDGTSQPAGSYVAYIGVLQSARGRGVAKSLLNTIISDAAKRGRTSVALEVDADSPTGAEGLYLSMGWATQYVTQSWHREVTVA